MNIFVSYFHSVDYSIIFIFITKTNTSIQNATIIADNRYRYPKEMGILKCIKSPSDFTLGHIVARIQKKHTELQAKIDRKKKAEKEWFDNKYQSSINNGGNHSNGNTR